MYEYLYTHIFEFACALAWLMILLPSVVYLFSGWRDRRDKLLARLDSDAIRLYFGRFYPSIPIPEDANVDAAFKHHFGAKYGRRHYVLPLMLLAVISGIGLYGTARSLKFWAGFDTTIKPLSAIAVSAFLGAYAWVLYDQLKRYRKEDFTLHDVYGCVYRFLVAIPLGLSLAAFVKEDIGIPFVFLLAAFPTQVLFKFSRRIMSDKLGLGENEEGGKMELEQLQSIGRSNAERYQDEGITTIAELAWSDPVDLTIKTNHEFNFVIDSISQALLWVYFQDDVKKLYNLSLRGAQEICALFEYLSSKDVKMKAAAETTVAAAATLIGLNKESFKLTLDQVKEDPYAQFLYKVWC